MTVLLSLTPTPEMPDVQLPPGCAVFLDDRQVGIVTDQNEDGVTIEITDLDVSALVESTGGFPGTVAFKFLVEGGIN